MWVNVTDQHVTVSRVISPRSTCPCPLSTSLCHWKAILCGVKQHDHCNLSLIWTRVGSGRMSALSVHQTQPGPRHARSCCAHDHISGASALLHAQLTSMPCAMNSTYSILCAHHGCMFRHWAMLTGENIVGAGCCYMMTGAAIFPLTCSSQVVGVRYHYNDCSAECGGRYS